MEKWALALLVVAAVIVAYYVIKTLLLTWAAAAYQRILKHPATACDIDAFVDSENKNPVNALKCVLAHKMQIGNRKASSEPIPLETFDSPHVEGLRVSRKLGSSNDGTTAPTASGVLNIEKLLAESSKTPIVIATIRMGFGHHRLAYSVSSWAIQAGHPTIFHDLLSIQSGTFLTVQQYAKRAQGIASVYTHECLANL